MKDNLENFKQISDEILEDIYVTDELERKTLERCNNKRFFKLNPLIVSTASAAAIMVAFGLYNHFSHNTNTAYNLVKHEDKSTVKKDKELPKIVENKKADDSKDSALNDEKKYNSEPQNKNLNSNTIIENPNLPADTKNANTTIKKADTASQSSNDTNNKSLNPSEDNSKNQANVKKDVDKDTDRSVPGRANLSCVERPLDIEAAEEYFEGKILLPSYVPKGFALTNISIPDHNKKCVKLSYSSDSFYFEILQSKNLSNLQEDKIISVGNNKAYESSASSTDTKISWITSGIQYSLSGNLPENSLIDIAKSIK